jgi:hypothetical protein
MHRREWYCKLCNLPISSRTAFQDHLEVKHSGLFIPTQLQVIIDRCERPSGANQQCPFCQIEVLQSHVHRHLAQHMQQIALFVINSSGEDIRGSARESDNPSLLKHQDDNPEARIQHAHPQESESMMTQTFSPKGASRFHPKPLQKKKVLIHQQIHQHINGRYITLTVLTEYLKKRWPTTRTEIDVSHFSPTRILLANSRN